MMMQPGSSASTFWCMRIFTKTSNKEGESVHRMLDAMLVCLDAEFS